MKEKELTFLAWATRRMELSFAKVGKNVCVAGLEKTVQEFGFGLLSAWSILAIQVEIRHAKTFREAAGARNANLKDLS